MDFIYQIKKIREEIRNEGIEGALVLAQNLIDDAIKYDEKYAKALGKYNLEITLQSSYFNNINRFKRSGEFTNEEYGVTLNSITKSLLLTLEEIEGKLMQKALFDIDPMSDSPTTQGFKRVDVDDMMSMAADLIKKARHFRVVGIGRQYIDEIRNIKVMNDYYLAIENRLLDVTTEDRFRYRRITIMELEENFRKHLSNCFENAEKSNNKNKAEVILLEDIEMQFTYFIIDEEIIVLNIYTNTKETVLDCPYAFWSKDPITINLFINHFDRVWKRENYYGKIITSKSEYEDFIPFNKSLLLGLREIKSSIKRLPRNSARTNWAIRELNQTRERLKDLVSYSLGIKNKVTNGKILTIFSYYMRQLKADDKYRTISFLEFWENITSEDTGEFYNANRRALINKAHITRIYVIDNDSITEDEYIRKQKLILEKHYNLVRDYKNYKFNFLFMPSNQYTRYLLDYKNFAIWENNHETILFRPQYITQVNASVSNFFPSMTYLHYIDRNKITHQNKSENLRIFDNAELDFEDILREQEKQKKFTDEQIFFLESCGIDRNEL